VTAIVVSGTGTGIGKTVVTAAVTALALARGVPVAVVKAAQTGVAPGDPGDLADVLRLCGGPCGAFADRLTAVEGERYPDPLSPAAAARLSGRAPIDPDAISAQVGRLQAEHALVIVEGAGGLLVRFDEEGTTIASIASRIGAAVLVVTEPGLGALNATALTLEALAHRGLDLAGLVIGSWPAEPDLACWSNVADFEMLAARPLAGALPAGAGELTPDAFLETARNALAPTLGGRFRASDFRAAAAAALASSRPQRS
jgi:dethiobiotin synthetase